MFFCRTPAHGGSDGSTIGMGWPERRDIVEWVYEILRRDDQAQIVLFGESMGAATVMMAAGEVLPAQVKLVVEDSGYTSAWEQFKVSMPLLYHTPPYPVLPVASLLARLRTGYGFRRMSALEQVRQCRIPILFIHGEGGTTSCRARWPCAFTARRAGKAAPSGPRGRALRVRGGRARAVLEHGPRIC